MIVRTNPHRIFVRFWLVLGLVGGLGLWADAAAALEAAGPKAKPAARSPSPPKLETRVYYLKYAGADSVWHTLMGILSEDVPMTEGVASVPVIKGTADPRTNALILVATPEAQAHVAELIKVLDRPAEDHQTDQIKVFSIVNADVTSLAQALSGIFTGDKLHVAVDARTNSIIAAGSPEMLTIVEAVLLRLDEAADRAAPRPTTYHVRVVWLASGIASDKAPEPARDLMDVLVELSQIGVTELRQVGQAVVYTLPDGHFQISCLPMYDEGPAQMVIQGELKLKGREDTPSLDIDLSAQQTVYVAAESTEEEAKPPRVSQKALVHLDTEIAAPYGHYVVLGVTPVGETTSVFVVQVTPGK